AGRSLFQCFQFIRRERDVLSFGEFVALDHLVALDLLAVLGADVLLLESGAVLFVQPVERDGGLGFARREELHGHGDKAKRHRCRTDGRSGHSGVSYALMPTRRKSRSEDGDALSTYRAKRAFDRTPEPGGLAPKAAPQPGGLLIVHMHDATRL